MPSVSIPTELPDKLTPVSSEDMFRELAAAWLEMRLPTRPSKQSVALLVAQWALETGWGAKMHCFNVGNAKAAKGDCRCWTFFACGEDLPEKEAIRLRDADPARVVIQHVEPRLVNGKTVMIASVYFRPKHPMTRFRAYHTLRAGAIDYLGMIRRNFAPAWPAVIRADATEFSYALKRARYYTADERKYAIGLSSIHKQLCAKLANAEFPVLSETEQLEVNACIARSLELMARLDMEESRRKAREND